MSTPFRIMLATAVGLTAVVFFSPPALAQREITRQSEPELWNRFRGPNGSGVDSSVPLSLDLAPASAKWQVRLPGKGHSSPILTPDAVIITSADAENRIHVEAYDRDTGDRKWVWSTDAQLHPMHRLNHLASSTPTTDGSLIFVMIPDSEHLQMVALTMAGEWKWQRDLGRWSAQHGFGGSPLVLDGKVIFVNSQEAKPSLPKPGTSEIIALAADSGQDLWRCPINGDLAGYGVPVVWKDPKGETRLLCATCHEGLLAIDPDSGKQLWNRPVFQQRIVGSPIVVGDRWLGNNGSGGGGNYLVSVDLADEGHPVIYQLHRGIGYVPSTLSVNGKVYSCTDNGLVSCWDLETGEGRWIERVSSGFWSSPVSDGRHLLCLDKDGELTVIEAGAEFRIVKKVDFGEATEATPAMGNGQLFIRTESQLFGFGSRPN